MSSLSYRAAHGFFSFVRAWRRGRGPCCRFHPTCSAYALEAVEMHGGVRGTWLAVCRVCRCRPFGKHGFDPVPTPPSAALVAPAPVASNLEMNGMV